MSSKDPYEILGVRPNAGREEIELAYKGRRSQYHPDRYAQSDAETQAWATGEMQEVNVAYHVLASSEQRAEFDRRRTSENSATDQPKRGPTAPAPAAQDAASVLLDPKWTWFHDKVYARPNIPYGKLVGAISSYAIGVAPSDVIALLDDTLFGGAKEGVLVTNEAIYCKQKGERARRLALNAIHLMEPGTNSRILVNGEVFFEAYIIDHLAIGTFASRLSYVFKPPTAPADAPRQHEESGASKFLTVHRLAMAALRNEADGDAFLVDDLIDWQVHCIADRFSDLQDAARQVQKPGRGPSDVDAACAEVALTLFLQLHYFSFSRLSTALSDVMGTELTNLYGVSEFYKGQFREAFRPVFGQDMEMDEEDLFVMSAAFFHRDGVGEFELNVPRDEALLMFLLKVGIARESGRDLLRQFERRAETWLREIA